MGASLRRALTLATLLMPFTIHAQTLRGITVDANGQPVPGVVVILLDSASNVVTRGMSNESGEFRVAAAHAGTYRLRTLRIGFRPTVSEPRALLAGGDVSSRVVLSSIPVALSAVRTTGQSVCRAFSDSGTATFAVWEQIHAALTAAELTASARIIVATTLAYDRTLENLPVRGVEHVLTQNARVSTAYVAKPWHEVPADSLHRAGYIVAERNDLTAYNAPGLGVLLSNGFIEDHCFRLTTNGAPPGELGVAFEPTPDRKRVAEIRGTLWIDRASAELRRLEFGYVNVSPEDQANARGGLEFQRARDGSWLVSRWSIRMPVFEQAALKAGEFRGSPKITAIQVTGGEVAVARRGSDTLWMRPRFPVGGTIRDSVSTHPVDGAKISLSGTTIETTSDSKGHFTLSNALPGEYTATVQTRSLDSVNTVYRTAILVIDSTTQIELHVPSAQEFLASICGRAAYGSNEGVILGSARSSDDTTWRTALGGLRVIAEWGADASDPAKTHRSETRAAADGSFRFCDAPLNAPITLRASADSAATANPKVVLVSSAVRLTRADLMLVSTKELLARGATFIGTVVSDSSHRPIAGVEVSLPELDKTTLTDSAGAFRIEGIRPGEHRVLVRRIGYGAADNRLTFTGYETVERRVMLGRAVTLEGVEVTARATDREMPGFEDNKRIGLGKFMTRVELEKFTGMKIGSALDQLSGISTVRGYGSQLWVASRRQPPALCIPDKTLTDCLKGHGVYVPDQGEMSRGMPTMCFAQVYIDRVLMNGVGEPTQPFDLATVVPESVEAIEWYAGAADTPMKYSRMGSNCGVLVIWTRRNP